MESAASNKASLPSWERGLKYHSGLPRQYSTAAYVAPLVGAWIEIKYFVTVAFIRLVAPLVGAWIEILGSNAGAMGIRSLPSWERGLKFLSEYS